MTAPDLELDAPASEPAGPTPSEIDADRSSAGGGLGRFAREWLVDVAVAAVASGLLTTLLFRLWAMPLRVPMDYTGDGLAQLSVTKGIIETGWNVSNPALGAPTGYVSYDFPAGSDNLHWLGLKVFSWFSSDAALVTNVYFLASFVMVAVVALVVLRLLGLPRWVAHPMALLFTFLPYHHGRGIAHLALANYVSVPLGCLLVLWAAAGRPAFFEPHAEGRLRFAWRTPRAGVAAVACIVLAIGGVYYAVFTVVLLAVGAALALLARVDRAHLLSAVAVVGLIGVVFVLNTLPALRYQADNGHNPGVAVRYAWEVDNNPLRPIQLVTPVREHNLPPLDRLGDKLRTAPNNSEPTQELGTLGSIGLVLSLGAVVAAAAGRRRLLGIDPAVGILVLAAIVMGVTGGFSWFLSLAGLAEIRSWSRISVFIGFFALYALGCALVHVARRRVTVPIGIGAAVVIVAIGLWDQMPTAGTRTSRLFEGAWQADRRYFLDVEALLPPDAMVFELPRLSYPEELPVSGEAPQEFLKPYLHTFDLRYSFGGMRGRESDWQEQAAPPVGSMTEFLDAISAVGFQGVLVNRDAYADRAVATEGELAALLGTEPLVSEGGDWAFYDLRPYADGYRAEVGTAAAGDRAERELARPTMWWGDGFSFQERIPSDFTVQHPGAPDSTSIVVNHTDRPWRGVVRFEARTYPAGAYELTIDGRPVPLSDEWTAFELPVSLESGERQTWDWRSEIPAVEVPGDPRSLAFTVRNVEFIES